MKKLLFWVKASRVEFLTGSVMPVFVCGAIAWFDTGVIHWGLWTLTLIAMMFIHAGANLGNDFFDHISGNDATNTEFSTPFTGGSRTIQRGHAEPWQMLFAALVAFGIGSAIGLYLVWLRGIWILIFGLIGVGSAFFYTAPPFKFGYRGLGEFLIALDFGILPALGTYYVQTGTFSWSALVAGLPSALLITAILWINQFQDMRADAAVNKRHWVVRMGRRQSVPFFICLILAAPISLIAGVLLGWLPMLALIGLIGCAPLPVIIKTALQHYDEPQKLTSANAGTVGMHLLTGLLITLGIVLGKL